MAEEGNEESWLYGSGEEQDAAEANAADGSPGNSEDATDNGVPQVKDEEGDKDTAVKNEDDDADQGDAVEEATGEVVPNPADEMEEADREEGERVSGEENSESEEDDDDINVVIGDINVSGPNYNIKQRGNLLPGTTAASGTAGPATDKSGKPAPGGKFNMEEFESVGTINGVPAHEFSIDSLDEKPWRKPGADITDYFNYGFNEETWRMYCDRQRRMRQNESGVGLQGLMVAPPMSTHSQVDRSQGPGGRTLTPIANDNSKYGVLTALPNRRAGPPPPRRMTGSIDVIGGNGMVKQENVIQVMTAERREYSRPGMPSGGKFDMPPPVFSGGPGGPPPSQGPQGPRNNMGPPGGGGGPGPGPGNMIVDAFEEEFPSYGYEPTQDSQWGTASGGNPGWGPGGIKELVPIMPQMVPAPMGPGMGGGMPPQMMQGVGPPQQQQHQRYPPSDRPSDRERSLRGERSDRERDQPRERERDRERDRSERGGDKERSSSSSTADKDRRSSSSASRMEREGSRRRDRSRSRERSRRRSRSREKTATRERSGRGGGEKDEKKRKIKDEVDV